MHRAPGRVRGRCNRHRPLAVMCKNDYWNTLVGRADRPHYPGHNIYPVDYVTDYRFTCIVSIPKTNTKNRWNFWRPLAVPTLSRTASVAAARTPPLRPRHAQGVTLLARLAGVSARGVPWLPPTGVETARDAAAQIAGLPRYRGNATSVVGGWAQILGK